MAAFSRKPLRRNGLVTDGRALRNSQFAIRNCQGFFSGFHFGMDDWGNWRLNTFAMCLDQIKTWTEISANIATVVGIILGIIGAVYAIRQWRLAYSQWRFQRYDKLYAIYQANINFINAVVGLRCSNQLMSEYARNVMGHELLFKPEIQLGLMNFMKKANTALTCESIAKRESDPKLKANLEIRLGQIREWFLLQLPRANALFRNI